MPVELLGGGGCRAISPMGRLFFFLFHTSVAGVSFVFCVFHPRPPSTSTMVLGSVGLRVGAGGSLEGGGRLLMRRFPPVRKTAYLQPSTVIKKEKEKIHSCHLDIPCTQEGGQFRMSKAPLYRSAHP